MHRSTPRTQRIATLGAAATLALVALSGCTATAPAQPTPTSSSTSTEGQQTVAYPEMRTAVEAADPRVQNVSVLESRSGAARVLTVGVRFSGDAAVSTETLTSVLLAIRANLPDEIDQVDLVARDDSEQNHLIDISTAVAGLPDDVTVLGDGAGLTIMRADLDKL